jgi:hypothetical protein
LLGEVNENFATGCKPAGRTDRKFVFRKFLNFFRNFEGAFPEKEVRDKISPGLATAGVQQAQLIRVSL